MDVREKLVELLEKASYECDEGTRDLWDMRQVADGIADFLIANGVTVLEWISVKDRLPEINEDDTVNCVLVTNGRVIHMAYFVNENWVFCENGQIKRPMFYDVTHWMPLPEPPKGE